MRERDRRLRELRRAIARRGPTFIVLDNHEDDREMARLLTLLDGLPVCWVITARRCLLSGVSVFPVVAPLSTARRSPFPRVAELTDVLRWNPLALDVANALVATGAVDRPRAARLAGRARRAIASRRSRTRTICPRCACWCDWAWPRVGGAAPAPAGRARPPRGRSRGR